MGVWVEFIKIFLIMLIEWFVLLILIDVLIDERVNFVGLICIIIFSVFYINNICILCYLLVIVKFFKCFCSGRSFMRFFFIF